MKILKLMIKIKVLIMMIVLMFFLMMTGVEFDNSNTESDGYFNDVEYSGSFLSPMNEGVITAFMGVYYPFGYPKYHNGTDMVGYKDLNIYPTAPGTVVVSASRGSYGNHVILLHDFEGKRYSSVYAHMKEQSTLKKGDKVDVNDVIGVMGNTGNSSGPHLHFEIRTGWYGYEKTTFIDVRNVLKYPPKRVYWTGRDRNGEN